MKRLKYGSIVVVLVATAIALVAASQPWFTLRVPSAAGGSNDLTVSGAIAAPALSALGFAALALAAALAIAGPLIRIVLGILGVVLGGSIVLAASVALSDPVAAGASVVTHATGVAGDSSVHDLVASTTATVWPVLAIVAGALLALTCLAVIVTARAWPASSRRYQAVRLEDPDAAAAPEPAEQPARDRAVDEWDELSRGDDPTATR